MDELDYWRLCEELTVIQAALLVVGEAPNHHNEIEKMEVDQRPMGYEAAKTAIIHALKKRIDYETAHLEIEVLNTRIPNEQELQYVESLRIGSIQGNRVPEYEYDINGNRCGAIEGSFDLACSTVRVASLKRWLRDRGFTTGFFFPAKSDTPDYLNPKHPRYAPKLAAAISAWLAVGDENLRRGKSAKSAMSLWLTTNYRTLGLIHKRDNEKNKTKVGDINKLAIQEAAKIANWEDEGGSPKTPL
jgi:hypothetical protein